MWAVIWEVTGYFALLVLISFLAWGDIDWNVFKSNENWQNELTGDPRLDNSIPKVSVVMRHGQ